MVHNIATLKSIETNKSSKIGRIPVRNLWLLMLYASDLFRELERDKISVEENPDDIPDLIARILCKRVEIRIQRNLSHGYQTNAAVISRVRGRIDILNTERHRLIDKGKVACQFDELNINTARNRYVRTALEEIAKITFDKTLSRRCLSLASSMRNMGVVGERPNRNEASIFHFGRHDISDQPVVTAAYLALNLALPTVSTGLYNLSLPEREITWVRKVYEKGIAGFYDVVLPKNEWNIYAGRTMRWQVSHKTMGIDDILPSMKTDIILDDLLTKGRTIIDTKFNSIVTRGWYRETTLRSSYIYQIYSYLRSQENKEDPFANFATGMLLHPSVGDTIDEAVTIQNHTIRFVTVNLEAPAKEIRSQLLDIINRNRNKYY